MYSHVTFHAVFVTESLVTYFTFVGLFSRVYLVMALQLKPSRKHFTARFALETFRWMTLMNVTGICLLIGQNTATHWAVVQTIILRTNIK